MNGPYFKRTQYILIIGRQNKSLGTYIYVYVHIGNAILKRYIYSGFRGNVQFLLESATPSGRQDEVRIPTTRVLLSWLPLVCTWREIHPFIHAFYINRISRKTYWYINDLWFSYSRVLRKGFEIIYRSIYFRCYRYLNEIISTFTGTVFRNWNAS